MTVTGHRTARATKGCGAFGLVLAALTLAGCSFSPGPEVHIAITEFESGRGSRVLLWPADEEGLAWRWIVDVPGHGGGSEVRTLHLPPVDRDVPLFDECVGSISALVPRSGGRRLRHRASQFLERLDATHPDASLSLIVTDCELVGVATVRGLLDRRGREVPWKGRYAVHEEDAPPPRWDAGHERSRDGIFIR
jgi:hypothetical protein